MSLRIEYQDVSLADVIAYFVRAYETPVKSHEYFVDTGKGRVVLKLYVDEDALNRVVREEGSK